MKVYQKITLIYFLCGLTWIILSDYLIMGLSEEYALHQTLKGIMFIIMTTALLYFLLKSHHKTISKKLRELQEQKSIETELKRKVQEHANNLNALFNASDDIIWSVNKDQDVVICNEAFKSRMKALVGHDNVHIDTDDIQLITEQKLVHWRESIGRALKGETFTLTYEAVHPQTAETEYYETSFFPLRLDNDEIIGVTCIARNVTQRKKHEMLIEKNNEKLMNIAWLQSHEVRAPLTRIMGLVDLLKQEGNPDKSTIELLNLIDLSAAELDQMIRRVVELTYELEDDSNKNPVASSPETS